MNDDLEVISIVDIGSFCHYDTLRNKVVISRCFHEDPELFNFLLEHEMKHHEFQVKYGFWSFLYHVPFDWISRFKMVTSDYEYFKKYFDALENEKRDLKVLAKDLVLKFIYGVLTFPTILFTMIGAIRILLDKIAGIYD